MSEKSSPFLSHLFSHSLSLSLSLSHSQREGKERESSKIFLRWLLAVVWNILIYAWWLLSFSLPLSQKFFLSLSLFVTLSLSLSFSPEEEIVNSNVWIGRWWVWGQVDMTMTMEYILSLLIESSHLLTLSCPSLSPLLSSFVSSLSLLSLSSLSLSSLSLFFRLFRHTNTLFWFHSIFCLVILSSSQPVITAWFVCMDRMMIINFLFVTKRFSLQLFPTRFLPSFVWFNFPDFIPILV